MESITRKFLVESLPDLSNLTPVQYSRFYLYISDNGVIRVQRVGEKYELERKVNESSLVRQGEVWDITEDEFMALIKISDKSIVRDSYLISEEPEIKLRVYRGDYEGLNRVEVSFKTVEESQGFEPPKWFDKEITDSPLAQEGTLLKLSKEEFRKLLEEA